ncbi:MAG: c-type cytochrome [Calditrichaeota bacterium]|nr:c-type cytochrome [Calditrichota bacterium]MCB9365793.1 c-type cytochrome [Calditrichota bacterium]
MSDVSPKNSSLFLYVPVAIFGVVLIAVIFSWQFKTGEEVGASLPPPVKEVAAAKIVNHRALAQDTGLAADGKMLYTINCASCHGNDGQGDGPRAAGLNPPPRNYKTETFKFGTDVAAIYNTLEKGSPGTSMPSFSLLPPRDVWAMVHYVRTLIPNPTPTDDAILAKLPEAPQGADAGTEVAAGAPDTEGRIPITLAMHQLETAGYAADKRLRTINPNDPGAQVYLNRCASCHGQHAEGMNSALLSVHPYRYGSTAPLYAANAPWLSDRAAFDDFVINGLPGRVHPGNGSMTRAQLDALYAFVQSLAAN